MTLSLMRGITCPDYQRENVIAYHNDQGIQHAQKEAFLNSDKIQKGKSIRQLTGDLNTFRVGEMIANHKFDRMGPSLLENIQ